MHINIWNIYIYMKMKYTQEFMCVCEYMNIFSGTYTWMYATYSLLFSPRAIVYIIFYNFHVSIYVYGMYTM